MRKPLLNKLYFICTCVSYVLFFLDEVIPYGKYILVAMLLLVFFLYVCECGSSVRIAFSPYLIYIFVFAAYCLLNTLWAEDPSRATGKIRRLFYIFGIMFILYQALKDRKDNTTFMLKVIMYGGYGVVLFICLKYGISTILSIISNGKRLSNEYLNANVIGLCAAYSIIIDGYFLIYKKNRISFRELLIIPAVLIIAASGSRKALVGAAFGFFMLIILKNLNNRNVSKSIGKMAVISLSLILLMVVVLQFPMFSRITKRMNDLFAMLAGEGSKRNSAWLRFSYNQLGLELFMKRPLLGIGIGNANIYTMAYYGHDHYLHNNYAELLACGGLAGFLIYYSIYFYLFFSFIHYRRLRDAEFDICFILLCLLLLMDIGMVTYYSTNRYFFLAMFWLEYKKFKNQHYMKLLSHPAQQIGQAAQLTGGLLSPQEE